MRKDKLAKTFSQTAKLAEDTRGVEMKLIAELYTVIQFPHLPLPQGIFNNRWTRSRACAVHALAGLWSGEAKFGCHNKKTSGTSMSSAADGYKVWTRVVRVVSSSSTQWKIYYFHSFE